MIPPPWRGMRVSDLQAVIALAALVHPGYPEDDDVLAERLALYPAGCFALDGPAGLRGYLLSHPWHAGTPPPLNRKLGALPATPSTYYIHDLALHPEARGSGAAASILGHLFAVTAFWPSLSLVAVNHSTGFWQRHGFVRADDPAQAARLASYGEDAHPMVRARS